MSGPAGVESNSLGKLAFKNNSSQQEEVSSFGMV